MTGSTAAASVVVLHCAKGLLLADSVEKHGTGMMIMAVASRSARGGLIDMPLSKQIMDFVG